MALFFTCKGASIKVLKMEDEKLSRSDAFRLAIHLNLCKMCREFAKQSNMIGEALKIDGPRLKLDPEFKAKLASISSA
jgi:hypothetical protein